MKNSIVRIFLAMVVGIYLVSTMGYGIHECSHDGTKNMMVLFGETPCSHSASSNAASGKYAECTCGCGCASSDSGHASHEHDAGCCSTEVYVLTQDQVNSQQTEVDLPLVSTLYLPAGNCICSTEAVNQPLFTGVVYSTGFTKIHSDLHIVISQFRI